MVVGVLFCRDASVHLELGLFIKVEGIMKKKENVLVKIIINLKLWGEDWKKDTRFTISMRVANLFDPDRFCFWWNNLISLQSKIMQGYKIKLRCLETLLKLFAVFNSTLVI